MAIVSETVPLNLILALIEAVNAVVGIPMIIYFADRYKNLGKAEEIKAKQVDEQAKRAGEVDDVRLTVS